MNFPNEIIDEIKSYVYCYSDLDTKQSFYIWKGSGNICFAHLYEEVETEKTEKIKALDEW